METTIEANQQIPTKAKCWTLLLLSVAVTAMLFSAGLPEDPFAAGSGTAQDPYQIRTCRHLQEVDKNLGSYFKIMVTSIDCSETSAATWPDSLGFKPLGSSGVNRMFSGSITYVGSASAIPLTITNLYINRPNEDKIGLFSGLASEVLSSLPIILKNAHVVGRAGVGAIAGELKLTSGTSTVHDSAATGKVQGTGAGVGGLFGKISSTPSTTGSINISLVHADAEVSGTSEVGGVAGTIDAGVHTINFSYSSSRNATSASGMSAGAIFGSIVNAGPVQLSNSLLVGSVSAASKVGSVVGSVLLQNPSSLTLNSLALATTIIGQGQRGVLLGSSLVSPAVLIVSPYSFKFDASLVPSLPCVGDSTSFGFDSSAGRCANGLLPQGGTPPFTSLTGAPLDQYIGGGSFQECPGDYPALLGWCREAPSVAFVQVGQSSQGLFTYFTDGFPGTYYKVAFPTGVSPGFPSKDSICITSMSGGTLPSGAVEYSFLNSFCGGAVSPNTMTYPGASLSQCTASNPLRVTIATKDGRTVYQYRYPPAPVPTAGPTTAPTEIPSSSSSCSTLLGCYGSSQDSSSTSSAASEPPSPAPFPTLPPPPPPPAPPVFPTYYFSSIGYYSSAPSYPTAVSFSPAKILLGKGKNASQAIAKCSTSTNSTAGSRQVIFETKNRKTGKVSTKASKVESLSVKRGEVSAVRCYYQNSIGAKSIASPWVKVGK